MISAYCPVKGSRVNLVQMRARGGTIPKELVDFIYDLSPRVDHEGLWCPTKVHADGELHEEDSDWGNCGRCY